jgi:LTXXQ motif family protein
MKARFVLPLLLSLVAAPFVLSIEVQREADDQALGIELPHSGLEGAVLAELLAVPSAILRGPRDVLGDYEADMTGISTRLSMELESIWHAVKSGELTREQGENISSERYQVAMMQFQVLSALHAMLEQDIAKTSIAPKESNPSQGSDILLVPLPFSSLQLSPSLAEQLGLSSEQIRVIQELMSNERQQMEPLMVQLRLNRQQLVTATQQARPNEKEISALAGTQARILVKLIVADSRMRGKVYRCLSPQQRNKFDDLKRANDLTLQAEN